MNDLPNDLKLSRISIPGTHDSMTKHTISGYCTSAGYLCMTQDMKLQEQLRAGIRFFDIRLKQDYGNPMTFHIYHGLADLDITLHDVMHTLNDFLKKHQNEAVILSYQGNACLLCDNNHVRDWRNFENVMSGFLFT